MSVLLMDIGNTRAKWMWGRKVVDSEVVQRSYTADSLDDVLLDCLQQGSPSEVYIGSVANAETTSHIDLFMREHGAEKVRTVSATDDLPGVKSGYRKPEQLGVDRILGMVAVREQTQSPFCVIDSGTATTLDFVDGNQHLGGFILPGLDMMRDVLLAKTSIPKDAQIHETDLIGRDTPTAVAMGARLAVVGLAKQIMSGYGDILQQDNAQLFLSGGTAHLLEPLFEQQTHRIDYLVLEGLAVIACLESD